MQTNIVLVTVGPDLTNEGVTASVVCDRLREKGVLGMAIMQGVIRFVTHSQVGDAWGGHVDGTRRRDRCGTVW